MKWNYACLVVAGRTASCSDHRFFYNPIGSNRVILTNNHPPKNDQNGVWFPVPLLHTLSIDYIHRLCKINENLYFFPRKRLNGDWIGTIWGRGVRLRRQFDHAPNLFLYQLRVRINCFVVRKLLAPSSFVSYLLLSMISNGAPARSSFLGRECSSSLDQSLHSIVGEAMCAELELFTTQMTASPPW